MMQTVCPFAIPLFFEGPDGGPYTAGPFRGILHTTEAQRFDPSTKQYYGHKNPPHFTLDYAEGNGQAFLYQHFKIDRASRALANPAGGVQTNRHSAIQIEICWTAKSINDMPDMMWDRLEKWMRWVERQTGIKPYSPTFGDSRQYGIGNSLELTPAAWKTFNGWCGHQHVPENAHWDPGPISIKNQVKLGLNLSAQDERPQQKADWSPVVAFLQSLVRLLK